ncbi:MAG: N-6 DNA methylase [Blastocatellia bacterium]
MLEIRELVELLGYEASPHFRSGESMFEPEAVHYFRLAKEKRGERFRVTGFYVFETGRTESGWLPTKPAVCVAAAPTIADADRLHRRIWNLGNVPFLIVRLPDEIRVYSGFRYDASGQQAGLILSERSNSKGHLRSVLSDFSADSIDSARIWQARRDRLSTQYRVDTTLLENLQHLAQALAVHCTPTLELATAHALIGKFVYLRYLRDRRILDDDWLAKQRIDLDGVFGPQATVTELASLVQKLEARFNGDVFHLEFATSGQLNDSHVQLVASVLAGDKIHPTESGIVKQLHLKFQAYDFRHIPVETLSSIYEQFLHAQQKGRSEGAYYTPEVVADYILSEVNTVRQLMPGAHILDASAGSGVFLVLAYRRLIELERRRTGAVEPMRLRGILLESIYGVERQPDACNVAAFSLILTLLNYIDPPALHANEEFKFPDLLNKDQRIFCDDFFNPRLKLSIPKGGFDFVVGNPPWIELKPDSKDEESARDWISKEKSIAGNRVADAFAVKAGRLLSEDGVAGLLLPATTLFTVEGKRFRQKFFNEFSVARVTNLANLRGNLFGGRVIQPAATLVFRKDAEDRRLSPILHFAPFAANQVTGNADQLWALTIHGSDIQQVSQADAAKGETSVWKLALWGTPRDARALDRIQHLYPLTLERLCEKRGWGKEMPREGAQLRRRDEKEEVLSSDELEDRELKEKKQEEVVPSDELKEKKRFDTSRFNKLTKGGLHFSLPSGVLVPIPEERCYVRKRGGFSGLVVNRPPHLMISATWKNFLIYSEEYFAIPPRQMGIAIPGRVSAEDREFMRALTVYLGSSLVDYFLFFQVPEWGVYSTFPHVVLRAVRSIPTPDFTAEQVATLAQTHRELILGENSFHLQSYEGEQNTAKQRLIDQTVFDSLIVTNELRLVVEDFRENRLPLDQGRSVLEMLGARPTTRALQSYGRTLRDELDRFLLGEARASVDLLTSPDLIRCEVRLHTNGQRSTYAVNVAEATGQQTRQMLRSLRVQLGERFSQWVYVDRSLRVFEDDAAQIYKAPRLMDWTRTQALNDADAIITDILGSGEPAT